jgi:5-methylcytosine-specific restriction endonuclease McrA
MTQYKTCSQCKQTKPHDEFGNHKGHSDGKASYCLICHRKARAAYRIRQKEAIKIQQADNYQRNREKRIKAAALNSNKNIEKRKISSRKWQQNNKEYMAAYQRLRTARKRNNDSKTVTKKELQKLYQNNCFYCGSKNRIEIDHVIPLARGGRHAIGNLVAACKPCNASKQAKFIMEWRHHK